MSDLMVDDTLEEDATDRPLRIQKRTGGTLWVEAGKKFSLAIDGDPLDQQVSLESYVNVEHEGDALEVIGRLVITSEKEAKLIARALLAPFAPRRMAAKDIPDVAFLAAVDLPAVPGTGPYWATWNHIIPAFPGVPVKVLRAKARKLIRRKLITGCDCGCTGQFQLTFDGRALLRARP